MSLGTLWAPQRAVAGFPTLKSRAVLRLVVPIILALAMLPIDAAVGQERMTRHERAIVDVLTKRNQVNGAADTGVLAENGAAHASRYPTHRSGLAAQRRQPRSGKLPGPAISICGVDELPEYSNRGITHAVSIWNSRAVADDSVRRRMRAEFPKAQKHYAFFDDVLAPGNNGPTPDAIRAILQFTRRLRSRDRLLVHCTKGISRSTAIAFATLCQHAGPRREAECLARVRQVRPIAQPNALIVRYADSILGRNGAMVAALQSPSL